MLAPILHAYGPWPVNTWTLLAAALGVVGLAAAGVYLISRRRRLGMQPARVQADSSTGTAGVEVATQDEHRQSPRPWGPPVEVLVSDNLALAAPVKGWVINRSLGGLCLSLAEPVALGSVLSIRTTNAGATVPWTRVEIKHCEFKVNRWHAGGQFVDAVSLEVLRLFGYR